MATTQGVDYVTIISHIDGLGIRVFDFVNHLTRGEYIGGGSVMNVSEGYLSVDGREPIKVALKEPRISTNTRDRIILNNIRQELRIMKHLEAHPYIINLFGVAFHGLRPVLVVEYAISTLSEYLCQRKEEDNNPVDWPNKSRICCEIADGLHALHQVKIVHGDVKGENILLFLDTNDNEKVIAKVSDFGYSSTNLSILEGRGTGLTMNFCAPECTRSAPAEFKLLQDAPTKDNYSYGLLVWQTAKDGEEPFEGYDIDGIDALKHSDLELKILMDQLDKEVLEEFRIIISGMTRYHPGERISLTDVRKIMNNNDIMHGRARPAFESSAIEPSKEFRLPLFNSIQLMALSPSVKSKIIRSYEVLASDGDAEAACFLSKCYASGFGVEADKEKMVSWAVEAAECGDLEAVRVISSHYVIYSDLSDYAISLFPWTLKAADDEGHQDSLRQVALCSQYGIGVEKNRAKSLEYTKLFEDNYGTVPWQPLRTLHRAASEGNVEGVKFVLKNEKPDINLKDDKGRTALHWSAEKGHFNISQMLLREFKADVNASDVFNRTPLHLAASNGHLDAVELFVIEFSGDMNAKDNDGRAPLHSAAEDRHFDIVKFVMNFGVDVNAKCNDGTTLLHFAARFADIDVVKLLISYFGSDLSAKDNHGRTPLYSAAQDGRFDMVKFLAIEFWCDVNVKNKHGWTPLHTAAQGGHVDMIKFLVIEFGVDVNAKDNDRLTALHLAASAGRIEAIQLLVLELGADMNAKDHEGQTPAVCAIRGGHLEVVIMLLGWARADVNMRDSNGQTLLHLAVRFRQAKIIKVFIEQYHLDIFAEDAKGRTPLELADEPPVHFGYACDGCYKGPIVGERHKCTDCYDFDFCNECFAKAEHTHNREHVFEAVVVPSIKHLLISKL